MNRIGVVGLLLISLLFLSACTLDARIDHLGESSSSGGGAIQDPPAPLLDPVSPQTIELLAKSAALSWQIPDANTTNFKLVYVVGTTPPDDCSDASAIAVSGTSSQLAALAPDTDYSYRLCSVDGERLSAGVTGQFKTYKSLIRTPAYASFANWNDYIKNDSTNLINATGTVCDGSELGGYRMCIHAGLIQKATLPVGVTCSNLKIYDFLGVFQWRCDDSASPTVVYSTGLKDGRGLKHLLSANSFLNNHIVVEVSSTKTYVSDSEIWWSNVVEPLPSVAAAATQSLTNGAETSGKIFVVAQNQSGGAYTIDSDRISIVTLDGAKLSLEPGTTGFITGTARKFLWIEGEFDGGANPNNIINLNTSVFSRVNLSKLNSATQYAIAIRTTLSIFLSEVIISKSGGAIDLTSGNYNHIHNSSIQNSGSYNYPIHMQNGYYNTLSRLSVTNSVGSAIAYPNGFIANNITIANISGSEYAYRSSFNSNSLFHNSLTLNSGYRSFYIYRAGGHTYSQIVAGGSTGEEIDVNGLTVANRFTNNLIMPGPECFVDNNAMAGLVNGTCANAGASDATFSSALNLTNVFVGKVTSDDSVNPLDLLGLADFSSITDWFNFANPFRSWGKDGSAFPNTDHQGICTAGTCRIWDYRLKADSGNLAYNRTENGASSTNGAFVAGATCPTAVHGGDKVTSHDVGTGLQTFLTNAIEIIEDGLGDDDSLCESNEACIYTPNFGAYQGEGDYLAQGTCIFQPRTITGVKMYAYPIIGVN